MRSARRLSLPTALGACVVLAAGPAHAAWMSSGSGVAGTTGGTLAAPATTAAVCDGVTNRIDISWPATTSTNALSVTYEVWRGTTPTPTALLTTTSGLSYQDAPGSGSYYYRIKTLATSWVSAGTSPVAGPRTITAGTICS